MKTVTYAHCVDIKVAGKCRLTAHPLHSRLALCCAPPTTQLFFSRAATHLFILFRCRGTGKATRRLTRGASIGSHYCFIRLCFWATIERHPRTREAPDATVHVLSYALRIGAFTYQWLRPTRRVQFRPTSQDPTSRQKLGTVRTGHNRGVNSRSQGYSVR